MKSDFYTKDNFYMVYNFKMNNKVKGISLLKQSLIFSIISKLKPTITKSLSIALLFVVFFISGQQSFAQCGPFQVYESFGTAALPTQGGTWAHNAITYTTGTTPRTGLYCLNFNAVGDIIQTPQIANPGVFSFWYKRSGTTTGTPAFIVETSPDNRTSAPWRY